MENPTPSHDPSKALADLAAVDVARERLTGGLRLPSGLQPALAVAVALVVLVALG